MICALLLLRATGASWVPFLAIPGVIAGFSLSVSIIVSGAAGLLAKRLRPILSARRTRAGISLTSPPLLSPLRR